MQHSITDKHKDNCKSKLNLKQLHLSLVSKSSSTTTTEFNESTTVMPSGNLELGVYCKQEDASKAELMWTMKSVLCNMSGSSCDGLVELFKAMFPNAVPDKFSLSRSKMSYLITDALGPHFRQIVLDGIQNHSTYYTFMYDETTNSESKKELQVAVRYWCNTKKEIVVSHLETFFIASATAVKIEEYLMLALDNADLPKEKLLMLGSDGPNVNKKVFRLVNEGIKSIRGHGLIDIGSCNIHIVHNAFLKGLESYGSDVSEFVIFVYFFFKGWPKRWEDYSVIQTEKGIPAHRFIKHCSSRWLTLGAAAERILEQWEALMHYFKIFVPKHRNEILRTPKFLKISSFIKLVELKPEIVFVVNSAKMFQQFTLTFQRQEPLIHVMYDELWKLLITIGGKVCKETALSTWNNNDSLFINENLKPLNSIELPDNVSEILVTFDEKKKIMFLKNVQTHYKAAGCHILEKSSFNHATKIKYFSCLQPNELKVDRSIRYIVKISEFMPFKFDSSLLIDEWRLLRLEKTTIPLNNRIDHYWNNIFDIKNNFGDQKYPFITKVVKAALTLSHGSADIERQFSVSGNVLTEDKTAMSCRMLNARLNIKQGIKNFHNRPDLVLIDKKLLIAAQLAKQNYISMLEKQKKEFEESNRQKLKKEEVNNWKKNLEEIKNCEKNIIKLEDQLKSAQKHQDHHKKAADKLLHDANVRLKKAIEKNDVVEMKIARSMVETATKLRNEEREKETETVCIQKKIEKRKNNIITKLNKKSKMD